MKATRARRRGVALLSAMITVTLVAALAASALWLQWRNVEVESAERQRSQAQWVLGGALDWARLILREDARAGGADHLAEPWAIPLAEARLSTFLAADAVADADATTTDGAAQAFLSGRITDMQSRLNVRNLVDGNAVSASALAAFGKLFALLGLPRHELLALAENLRLAYGGVAVGGERTPLAPQRLQDLRWLGLSERSLALLEPHISLLPVRTPVNLNTAGSTVLYAAIADLSLAQAQELANKRQSSHFRTLSEAASAAGVDSGAFKDFEHSISSQFFEVQGRLRLDQTVVQQRSLVQREGMRVRTLWREAVTDALPPPQPLAQGKAPPTMPATP